MNILNNITNETINIPELIGLEIGKLIKNKNLLNKYYNDGYKINIDNRVRGREYEKRKFKDNTIRRTWRNR